MKVTFENLPQIAEKILEQQQEILRRLPEHSLLPEQPTIGKNMGVRDLQKFIKEKEGKALAVQTIYGLVQRRDIPFKKRGKRLVFNTNDITLWLENGRSMDELILNL